MKDISLNPKGKINAPTLAYKAVYGKFPDTPLRGRTNNPKKIWKGIDVDVNLKDEWLEELNNLPLDIKSTDEGKSKERVAFVIFRLPKDKEHLYKKMELNLKKEKDLYILSDIGNENRPRICVAKDITYEDKDFVDWWKSLSKKLKRAYEKLD